MKLLFTILFQFILFLNFTFSCTFDPNSFCETAERSQNNLIVSGFISAIDDDGINFEIIQLIRGNETNSNIRIWDGTDFYCNGPFSMAASDIGDINDSLILILPKIDSVINSWDVIGDYRRPDNYQSTTILNIKKNTVEGLISGLAHAPPEFNLLSFDYSAFVNSWADIQNCSKIVSSKNIKKSVKANIYPNPANEFIRLKTEESFGSFDVKIYNQIGVEILSIKNLNDQSDIPVENFSKGVYYLAIEEKNIKISFAKL